MLEFEAPIDMKGKTITNLKDAVNLNDAVNKSQVDAVDAKFANYYNKIQTDAKFTNYYDKIQTDDYFCQPGYFFNRLGHNNTKTVIFPFTSYPPVFFPKSDLSDTYHNIGEVDNILIEVKKDGVYQIEFSDFYKDDSDGKNPVFYLQRVKRHEGNAVEKIKILILYLDKESDWVPLTAFHILRLRQGDNIGITTEGVILDGEQFSTFLIKK